VGWLAERVSRPRSAPSRGTNGERPRVFHRSPMRARSRRAQLALSASVVPPIPRRVVPAQRRNSVNPRGRHGVHRINRATALAALATLSRNADARVAERGARCGCRFRDVLRPAPVRSCYLLSARALVALSAIVRSCPLESPIVRDCPHQPHSASQAECRGFDPRRPLHTTCAFCVGYARRCECSDVGREFQWQ
jgi:hypothetical protein